MYETNEACLVCMDIHFNIPVKSVCLLRCFEFHCSVIYYVYIYIYMCVHASLTYLGKRLVDVAATFGESKQAPHKLS